jgi:phage protein U
MSLGTFGDIIFSVSNKTLRTFDEFSHTVTGRWEVHEPIGTNPRPEFIGPGQGEISFKMQLFSSMGIDPRTEMEKVERMVTSGDHAPIIIGGRPVGSGDWYVESRDSDYRTVSGDGKITSAEVALTVKEYH